LCDVVFLFLFLTFNPPPPPRFPQKKELCALKPQDQEGYTPNQYTPNQLT
jgi:hypothetical protein